jgi:hypothetical protein
MRTVIIWDMDATLRQCESSPEIRRLSMSRP